MWYIDSDGEWADSKREIYFKETLNRTVYVLNDTEIKFYGAVGKNTIHAIKNE